MTYVSSVSRKGDLVLGGNWLWGASLRGRLVTGCLAASCSLAACDADPEGAEQEPDGEPTQNAPAAMGRDASLEGSSSEPSDAGAEAPTDASAPRDESSPSSTDAASEQSADDRTQDDALPEPVEAATSPEGQPCEDGIAIEVQRCIAGVGACERRGIFACVDGQLSCNAVPGAAQPESCNAIDDDCDGESDEDFDLGATCSVGEGHCARQGEQICDAAGLATCSVNPGVPRTEVCNAEDDDCDGMVDNRHVCEDYSVQNTQPFDGAAWLIVNKSSSCGDDAVFPFWPEQRAEEHRSRLCSDGWATVRADGELFSRGSFGIERHIGGPENEVLATPGCDNPGKEFGFDSDNRLYYRCFEELWREAEILSEQIDFIAGVTSDGRTLAHWGEVLKVIAPDGSELAAHDLVVEFTGDMLFHSASVNGNDVYLLYHREISSDHDEIVVVRLDEANQLLLVRRMLPVDGAHIPTADGSVFQATVIDNQQAMQRHPPEGSTELVWLASDAPFEVSSFEQLLVGPRL